ncbi:hypothetical protein [Aquisediminimonas profunda]|uniref:hypothetical protein n=1 Tax=Aquisediminimonas profunda TaxID=1550733 RepID=UPI001C630275|nr:hypothetical protein [Aquisediminimonas profunda]
MAKIKGEMTSQEKSDLFRRLVQQLVDEGDVTFEEADAVLKRKAQNELLEGSQPPSITH